VILSAIAITEAEGIDLSQHQNRNPSKNYRMYTFSREAQMSRANHALTSLKQHV
jgi:hypothetical protein